jgi:hypothetical protein
VQTFNKINYNNGANSHKLLPICSLIHISKLDTELAVRFQISDIIEVEQKVRNP